MYTAFFPSTVSLFSPSCVCNVAEFFSLARICLMWFSMMLCQIMNLLIKLSKSCLFMQLLPHHVASWCNTSSKASWTRQCWEPSLLLLSLPQHCSPYLIYIRYVVSGDVVKWSMQTNWASSSRRVISASSSFVFLPLFRVGMPSLYAQCGRHYTFFLVESIFCSSCTEQRVCRDPIPYCPKSGWQSTFPYSSVHITGSLFSVQFTTFQPNQISTRCSTLSDRVVICGIGISHQCGGHLLVRGPAVEIIQSRIGESKCKCISAERCTEICGGADCDQSAQLKQRGHRQYIVSRRPLRCLALLWNCWSGAQHCDDNHGVQEEQIECCYGKWVVIFGME